MTVIKEFVSLTIVALETGKIHFFSYHGNRFYEGKCFNKNINLKDTYYHWKIDLIGWMSTRPEKNVTTTKMYILRKKPRKLKNMLFLNFTTTFHNFALKTETSLAERMVKPVSKYRTVKNSIHVWFIHSGIKFFQKIQYKKG